MGLLLINGDGLYGLPAINHDGGPDDEPGHVRAQPENRIWNFLRVSGTADRLLSDRSSPPLRRAAGEPLHHGCVDDPGTNGIHADIVLGIVQGGAAR